LLKTICHIISLLIRNEFTASKNKFEDKGTFRTSTPLYVENNLKGIKFINSPCFTPKTKKAYRKGSTNISPLLKQTLMKEFEHDKQKLKFQFSPSEVQSKALKNYGKETTKENVRPSYLSSQSFDKENNEEEEDNIPDEYEEFSNPLIPIKNKFEKEVPIMLEMGKIQEFLIPSMLIKTKQEMTSANAVLASPRRFSDTKKIYTSKYSNEIFIKSKSKTNSASPYSAVRSFNEHKTNLISTFFAGEKKAEDSNESNEELKIIKLN